MLSTFERKIISLLRILYPVKLAQENTGKHTFLYEEHKTPQEIVGGKKFPEWHLADAEDTQTRQNSETQEKDMLRVVTIEIPLGRMLGWAQVLMCACFLWPHADEVLALSRVPTPASSEYIYFTPKCLLFLRAGGGNWWSYGAAHFFWLYSCWRSHSRPTLQLSVVCLLFPKLPFLLSDCWESC